MLRRFVRWLASKLDPPAAPEPLPRIQYIDEHGRECVGRIVGPVGFYLDIRPLTDSGGMQAKLIGENDAVDPKQFWEQWRAWGGELFFEDGRPWQPPM